MLSVGAAFPRQDREQFARRSLVPGRVLYLSCPFTRPPKDKFVIVAACGDPPLLILMNSSIHAYIQCRPHLLACQVLLPSSRYGFLRTDSYANCAEVFDHMREQEIVDQLTENPERVKDTLHSSSIREILDAVRAARTVSVVHAARILEDLSLAFGAG